MRTILAVCILLALAIATGCQNPRHPEPYRGQGFSQSGEVYQNRD